MTRFVPIDAGPLGLDCCDPAQPEARRCRSWLDGLVAAGIVVMILTTADYEVRRELLRVGASSKLRRLDEFRGRFGMLDITADALDRASAFWADLRRRGLPTAGAESLDADAILAGMAATIGQPGDRVTVATTNVRHLDRFPGVEARDWRTIG